MTFLVLIVLLPFLAIPFVWLAGNTLGRRASALIAGTTAATGLVLLSLDLPSIMNGDVIVVSLTWIERLGLNFALRLDGLGALFTILILGIGVLVVIYAYYYLGEKDPIGPFYAMLMTFMGAMLGVVLSENLLLLAMFWELTSISSFLLIGYWKHLPKARQGARLALMITGSGGLLMLTGIILLGWIVGSFDLTVVLASQKLITSHELYPVMLVLVLMGAFTKSAQFPFHFWLPNAMTAPTPVSAYLHSATMVKAGVFLLARMHPALSGTSLWFYLVTGAGLVTLVFAAYVALFKHDLKGLLAYSTISHLGIITALFGFSTKLATVAGVFHIMNHAAFKASLFMSAGIVDHEAGTRDARLLSGLRHSMPFTFVLALIGALAMGGAPLFNGFLSKEMFFEESFHLVHHPVLDNATAAWLIPVLVTLGGLFSVAYSVRFIVDVFFGPEAHDLPKHPHEPPFGMRLPVVILVAICVVVGVAPFLVQSVVEAFAAPVVGATLPKFHLAIWHGITPGLGMTAIAVGGGVVMYKMWPFIHERLHMPNKEITGKQVFESIIEHVVLGARWFTNNLDNGSLQRYIAFSVSVSIAAGALAWYELGWVSTEGVTPAPLVAVIPWIALVAGALLTVWYQRKRLVAVVFASVVGLVVSLTFFYLSGPDLGLTQLSVEVVTILLILLTLYVLPQWTPRESSNLRRARDAAIAVAAGLGTMALAWGVFTRPFENSDISNFYLEKSVPEGGGANVVNVILVDFRGFDTMGEISVLVLAAIGILVMLRGKRPESPGEVKPYAEERFPLMLTTVTRPFMALILLVAVYIFLRGHNTPGGGFIAGLVAAVALIIQYVASGLKWSNERLDLDLVRMGALGVVMAVSTGMAAWAFGSPFLDNGMYHLHVPLIGEIHLASAIPFDLGVFLVVVSALLLIIRRLSEYQRSPEVVEKRSKS